MSKRLLFLVFVVAILLVSCDSFSDTRSHDVFVGSYQASLPSASSAGRTLVLQVNSDRNVQFSQDYQNEEAPIVELGFWRVDPMGVLVVDLDNAPTYNFLFDQAVGTLTLLDPETSQWGENGLVLHATTPLIGTWVWQETGANGQTSQPSTADVFTISFLANGLAEMATDCNSGSGEFLVTGKGLISMPIIATTKKFCEGSNEGDFFAQLGLVEAYEADSQASLDLFLGGDGGTMHFTRSAE